MQNGAVDGIDDGSSNEVQNRLRQDRIRFFKEKYMSKYIDAVEKQLRVQNSRISRNEIIGYILEKIAKQQTENITPTNGDYRLKLLMGEPELLADEFIEKEKKLILPQMPTEEELEKRDKLLLEYQSLSKFGKLKFKVKEKKQSKTIPRDLIKSDYTNHIFFLHIMIVIFNLIYGWFTIDYALSLAIVRLYAIRHVEKHSRDYFWHPEIFVVNEGITLFVYLLTAVLFRTKNVENIQKKNRKLKWIKSMYIINFGRYIASVVYFYFGTIIPYNYPLNGYKVEEMNQILIITAIIHILIIITLLKGVKPRQNMVYSSYVKQVNIVNSSLTTILYRPFQIAIYWMTIVVLLRSVFSIINLNTNYLFLYADFYYNYSYLFYNCLIVISGIFLGIITPFEEKKVSVKKRIKRQLTLQMGGMILYEITLYVIWHRNEYYNNINMILISILVYYVGNLILIWSTRLIHTIQVNNNEEEI